MSEFRFYRRNTFNADRRKVLNRVRVERHPVEKYDLVYTSEAVFISKTGIVLYV
jgi:hypothetical protein